VKIILDSNLLLLLVVGFTSRDYIKIHKRLNSYIDDDFILLTKILNSATGIIVTPNTLTETSNLVGYVSDPARSNIYRVFQALVEAPGNEERFIESKIVMARTEFVRLGLTDAALLQMATEAHTLLTADVDLYLAALKQGLKAENFNHLRNL
jgi:hypothetical protein